MKMIPILTKIKIRKVPFVAVSSAAVLNVFFHFFLYKYIFEINNKKSQGFFDEEK